MSEHTRSQVFRTVHDFQKGYRPGSLVDAIMEIIEQERRAAAEAMRERCAAIAEEYSNTLSYEPMKVATGITRQIRTLPLDSDGGA